MSVLCSACKMRPAHRVWDSGRGKCGDCYALDPSEPPAALRHEIVRAKSEALELPGEGNGGQAGSPSTSSGQALSHGTQRVESEKQDEPLCPKHAAALVLRPADAAQPHGRQVWRCPWAGCAVVAAVADEPEESKPALSQAARAGRRRQEMAQANPKREAVLAEARTGKWTCKELAQRHGLTYSGVYTMCSWAKVKLRRMTKEEHNVQARAQNGGGRPEAGGTELARAARAVQPARNFDPRAFEAATGAGAGNGLTLPFTPAVSAALWQGLPLALQHRVLATVFTAEDPSTALRAGAEDAGGRR